MHRSMPNLGIFSRHRHTQSFPPSILSSKGKNDLGTGSLGVFPVKKFAQYLTSPMPLTLDYNSLLLHSRKAEHSISPLLSASVVTGWCRLNADTLVDNMQRWCRNSSQPAVDCEVLFFGIPLLNLVWERGPDLSIKCHRTDGYSPSLLCKDK